MYDAYRYMYDANINILPLNNAIFDLDNIDNITSLCNVINDDFPNTTTIRAYEAFDMFRAHDDDYKDAFSASSNNDDIFDIYHDEIAVLRDNNELPLVRNFAVENQFVDKLSGFFNLHFCIVSDDAYRTKARAMECHSINIFRIFPNNSNILYLIKLIQEAAFFIVSDDALAALLYTLLTKKVDTKLLLGKNTKVYFDLKGKDVSSYPSFVTPSLANWVFQEF
jgi:hypothetical protein